VLESEEVFLDVIELAVELHSRAAELASHDGPVSALDVAESLRKAIAEIS
jgi:NAD(P)H-hydrate repair Nnr-like enzyme with NAD(P)H-hydrate dehydratase domain